MFNLSVMSKTVDRDYPGPRIPKSGVKSGVVGIGLTSRSTNINVQGG
jgi:hypothetical protein